MQRFLKRMAVMFGVMTAISGVGIAQAQTQTQTPPTTFPSKPVRLICPFPPGGAVDIASRAIAVELAKNLGQPVTVENKPGAGGNIGGQEASRAAPDGYTIFMTTSGIQAINPALYAKMPFDPSKDLASVTALVSLNNVLVLRASIHQGQHRSRSDCDGQGQARGTELCFQRQRYEHSHVG